MRDRVLYSGSEITRWSSQSLQRITVLVHLLALRHTHCPVAPEHRSLAQPQPGDRQKVTAHSMTAHSMTAHSMTAHSMTAHSMTAHSMTAHSMCGPRVTAHSQRVSRSLPTPSASPVT